MHPLNVPPTSPRHGCDKETHWTIGVVFLTVFNNIHMIYSDYIRPNMYVDKKCPLGVGYFLCFDTSQCQFSHMSQGVGGAYI